MDLIQNSIKDRGNRQIYENREKLSKQKFEDYIKNQLIDLYVHLGKITNLSELLKKREERYQGYIEKKIKEKKGISCTEIGRSKRIKTKGLRTKSAGNLG